MKTLFSLLFFLLAFTSFAQKVIDVGKSTLPNTAGSLYSVGGQPFQNFKYVKVVDGTPYFKEDWMGGKVIMSGGFAYDSIYLRLDLMDHSVHYLEPGGREMLAAPGIKAVILSDSGTGKKYQFIHSSYLTVSGKTEPGWYQLIAEGKATLLKRFVKTINETKPYGSGTTEQTIVTFSSYFLLEETVLTPVKKFKDLPNMVKDKKEELRAYIGTKNLSGRSDADYADLISYYNSLVEKQ